MPFVINKKNLGEYMKILFKDDFTNTTISLWAVFCIILLILILIMNISSETKKDTDFTYTVISSDGTKYSKLTKQFFNNCDFITKEGKRISFTGNHITIEE